MRSKRKGLKSFEFKRRIFYICLLAYPLAHFAVFYIGVNINSILLSFQKFNGKDFQFLAFADIFVNFKNFANDLFRTALLKYAVKNSLLLYAAGLIIGLPLNLIFSFFLYKKIPLKGFFRVLLFLPQIISSIVMTLMFKYFVERGLPGLLKLFGYDTNKFPYFLEHFGTYIFYNLWAGFGTQIIIYSSAMSRVSDELIESGKLDGMNLFQEFTRITLPLIFPTISLFLIVGVAGIFTSQAALYNFSADGAQAQLYTLGYYLFVRVIGKSSTLNDYPYAAAAGILFTVIAFPITMLAKFGLDKIDPTREAK